VDLTVVDASFIGLAKLAEAIARCTRAGGALVALIKPQFEVAREEASRGRGVVRDEAVRCAAIAEARASLEHVGFDVVAEADCVITGRKGNREAFVHARRK
jgi:23S rRNA (cytidine1920-2'-O)/16S rRNA (cytidine1409-2'-O)-methyltransferase